MHITSIIAKMILKVISAGVGFGSGTGTTFSQINNTRTFVIEVVPWCDTVPAAATKTGWGVRAMGDSFFLALSLRMRLAWANRRLTAKQLMPKIPAVQLCA